MYERWVCFVVGVGAGIVLSVLVAALVMSISFGSVHKSAICNQAGYLEAVKVGGINGEWRCHTPILDIEGL